MDEEEGYTPEELKRMGLAGGAEIRVPRVLVRGIRPVLASLRPPWPGLLRTIAIATVLVGLGWSLVNHVNLVRYLAQAGRPAAPIGLDDGTYFDDLIRSLRHQLDTPWRFPVIASDELFTGGWLAAPLALLAGIWLFVRNRGGNTRALALLSLGAGGFSLGLGLLWPFRGAFFLRVFPGPVATLFGSAVAAWLLLRPASGRKAAPLSEAIPGLLLAGALLLNLELLFGSPEIILAYLLGHTTRWTPASWSDLVSSALPWTRAVAAVPLLFVPALIVCGRSGFCGAIAGLARAARHAPVALLLAYILICGFAFAPIARLLQAPFYLFGAFSFWVPSLTSALVGAVAGGVETGVRVYVLARLAGAIAEIGVTEAYSPE